MSAISLEPADLVDLVTAAKDLNFNDVERRSALLENGSRDFNAVPGSGKTSLLAAKLLLLAKKWPHARRGICVLSHTNVARDEIAQRLAGSDEAAKLLSYPHFVGTIHAFVNQFFAMPMLRSLGQKVDVIDDVVFADKAKSLLQLGMYSGLRVYLENQNNGDGIATSLFYRGADMQVHVESGTLPGSHTASYKSLMQLKKVLTKDGIFRHRDMFAYADLALKTCPHLVDVVHRRFPMVFIDEMQDTSWDQEHFLKRIFDGKSVMQRFGDIDQKILSDEENADLLTFPRIGYGCISTSKRFGPAIASAVGSVRLSGTAVVGEGTGTQAPVLFLYSTADAANVLSHYGRLVIDRLTEDEAAVRQVKAMCARKSGEGKVAAGRHLVDYWPAYGEGKANASMRSERFWELIGNAKTTLKEASLSSRVSDVRRALLLVLRSAKSPLVDGMREARALARATRELGTSAPFEGLTRHLVLSGEQLCVAGRRDSTMQLVYAGLKPYLPTELEFDEFSSLGVFVEKESQGTMSPNTSTRCQVSHLERSLEFGLGTIAGMKGETHWASLVLESYGGTSRKFDVALGLEYIAGIATKKLDKLPKTQQAQMRNLYVAMSRPSALLCLAANEERVPSGLRTALLNKGWHIEVI